MDKIHYDYSKKLVLKEFICELNSFEDYKNEIYSKSIMFSFESEKNFRLRICGINVYQFQDECGIPDKPLQALIRETGKTVEYNPTPQEKKYRMIGNNTINCRFEGNWDKEPPLFEPITQCNIEKIQMNSSIHKSFQFLNLEFFNKTEVAVIDSKILFQCNNEENSSIIRILTCNENGSWIGDDLKCKNKA